VGPFSGPLMADSKSSWFESSLPSQVQSEKMNIATSRVYVTCRCHTNSAIIRRGRTWDWARMRRYRELSKDQEPLLPLEFCSDCIIVIHGFDFR
jgi:hypothetical protein